jgi:chemotaxis response regulator CheB
MGGYFVEMNNKHILLADGSRLLREVVKRVIEKSAGLEVVGEIADVNQLPIALEKTKPDWIVYFLSPGNTLPESIKTIMKKNPAIRILEISMNGGQVKIEWLGLREKQLNDSSLEGITDLLRSNLLNGEVYE